ncbi:MAG: exodeoxyribonuclease III [Planctomycetaceae bacterium]|nr:exodeoxyribonuclease III [Planctomycetaceae bacterium]
MRITTWNVNGLRAAIRKGLADVLEQLQPDVLLMQEVRATPDQLPAEWASPPGWHVVWNPARKKGYSGTAVWSRTPIEVLETRLDDLPLRDGTDSSEPPGDDVTNSVCGDPEGRLQRLRCEGVEILNVYLPSGSSGEARQQHKEAWMKCFRPWLDQFLTMRRPVVLGGDLNIAHTARDIYYAKANEGKSGFLPHEREWMGGLLEAGYADLIREQFPDVEAGPYSWWSNRGRARELDRGWRIDYLLANRAAKKRVSSASIDREASLTISDHAPVTVELD